MPKREPPPTGEKQPFPLEIKRAKVVSGAGRGRGLNVPTLNIDLNAVPSGLSHGIYACWINIGGRKYMGAMHYGPRPVFKDSDSLEIHVIDSIIAQPPETADLTVVARLRDVRNFPGPEELKAAIKTDIEQVRAILSGA